MRDRSNKLRSVRTIRETQGQGLKTINRRGQDVTHTEGVSWYLAPRRNRSFESGKLDPACGSYTSNRWLIGLRSGEYQPLDKVKSTP